jgi:hypothetical protein
MSEDEGRYEEGKSPAAWVLVWTMLFGISVGTYAVCVANWVLFSVGVGISILGLILGKVMSVMGYGQYPKGKPESVQNTV